MDMPTIRVDDEVFGWLKTQAEPFVDTPNTVLRRLSGLDSVGSAKQLDLNRARMGELLDRKEYDEPILLVLARRGGSAQAHEVVDEVGETMRERLTEKDLTENQSGVIRWRNRVMWRRFVLVQAGLLKSDSPRGLWELTEAGWNRTKQANRPGAL